ncbi:MAG TPA: rhomboid family intramembrane serine protease [Pseudolysinimonas sp.]|nr:rhomboid family intramembrane serine protease [Pseudolysinimonas sp.]
MTWTPTSSSAARSKARTARARRQRDRPRWQQTILDYIRPSGSAPAFSWILIGVVVVLWLASIFTADGVFRLLAVDPSTAWQPWRYVTAAVAYPTSAVLSVLLGLVFFALFAPSFEAQVGRRVFLWVFTASSVAAMALAVLAGAPAYGISAGFFGVLGAYLVKVWAIPQARIQLLIIVGINLLITLLFSGSFVAIVVGVLAGAGVMILLTRHEPPRARPAYAIVVGGAAVLIVLAIVRWAVA